jgi:hypothetical protein
MWSLTVWYSCNIVIMGKSREMARSTGEMRNTHKIEFENLKGRNHSGGL